MTASKTSLLTQIEETLARNSANVSANLINIAQIFAQLDERFAAMEAKLSAEPSARAELLALIDQRIKIALERNEREHLDAVAGVVRDVLADFMGEFRQLRKIVEGKLAQPFDPAARERPN